MSSNYSTLVAAKATTGSIKSWVSADNIPSEIILSDAEAEIYRRLRVRQMLVNATGTIADGDQYLTLPTRFRRSKGNLRIVGTNQGLVRPKEISQLMEMRAFDSDGTLAEGKPAWFGINATQIMFDVEADQAYSYEFLHYAALAPLAASSNETNFLTDEAPRVLRAMCMAYAYEFITDEAMQKYWLQIALDAIAAVNAESDLSTANVDERVEVI